MARNKLKLGYNRWPGINVRQYSDSGEDSNESDELLDESDTENTELVNNEEICDLFNLESLRKFVTSSDKVELSISDVLSTTIAWLEDRAERRENSVTKFQFINFLESHGLTAEKGAEAFDQLDIEGQGIINSKDFMELFKQRFRSQNDELNGSNYMFTTCPLTPGRVNALTNEGKRKDLYRSLMKYIINNQISATSVPFPPLNYINDSFALRDKAIAKIMGEMSLKVASTTYDDSGEKQTRTLCLKCHQKLEVSSNSDTLNNLLDGNFHTCWQSDGITGTHWIRLSIKPDVELTELSIYVVPVDQSYMPKQVSVSAGFDADSVNIVSTVTIPNSHHGYFKVYERHSNTSYTVFQINIQRCHSGGCDTRIRGIKTIGYRYAKPAPELNIVSSSITWLLSIVTETVKAALPVSPSLKKALLNHAKIALRDFKPLCLSTTQNLIKYLSNRTQESIENFLYALIDDNDPNTKAEVLECFLTFSLATADLGSIIRALNLLVDNSETKLKCRELLVSMYAEYYKLLRSSRDALDISLFYCDVQAKDDQNLADTVLQDSGTFSTATGEKKATLVFTCKKEAHVLQLTALKFKTAKGSTCPKYCLVFVINDNRNDSSFCLKSLLNDLKKYDDMTTEQYEKMIHDRRTKSPYDKSNLNPVVCMDFMSDRYETFVEMDVIRTGKYVVVKLLGTQGDEADRLSIRSIKFLGFSYPKIPEFDYINVDAVAPIPDSAAAPIEADSVVLRVTNLICSCLLKQRNLRKQSTVSKNKFFHDNNSLNLSTIWKLYSFYTKRNDNKGKLAKILILRVLYLTLPRLKTSESWKELQNDSNESNNDNSANKDATVASRQEMFSHLCSLVNDNSINSDHSLVAIVTASIIEGTEVFFPRPETCCQYLAELLDELKIKISTGRRSDHSVAVTLRSLCRYFISGHAMFLLKLPENVTSESDLSHALKIIQKVLELSFRECESIMRAYHYHDEEYKPTGITQLLNVLQRYLFSWCYNQLRKPITDIKIRRQIEDLINKYTTVVVKRMNICLEVLLQDAVNKEQVVLWTRHTFLSVTCRELMLLLPFIVKEVNTIHKFVVDTFQPITVKLIKLAAVLPKLFFTLNDLAWECVEDKVELRIWNEESNHNYENNLHVTKTFYCPGAHSFVVEFDERCRTERSFDYLEFVDKTGNTKRFDYKVGFEKWPTKATFQGHNLRFTFNSDSSNTDWGYKFKVSAFGYKLASLPWLFDLFLSHGRLIGFLCRELYIGSSRRKLLTKDTTSTTDEPTLEDNKIWQTIFRGGIEVGKTLTRSLSGYHSSEGSKSSSSFEFISDLAKNEGDAEKLLKRCRKILGYQSIGGNLVNCTVDATFAALIWHNQYLRDDILKIVNADQSPAMIPPGILCAMAAAENFRKDLVSRKQRIIASQDTSDINNNSVGDELNTSTSDDYVISCWNKAQFLLKLSSQPSNIATLAKSHGNLTVNEKRQLHQKLRLHFGIKVVPASLEKLTSNELDYLRDNFKIILGFIRSSKINVNEVEESFHARTYRAKNLIHTFNQATEYLKALMKEDTTSLPAIVFLEYLLQDQKDFPSHFLDGVEGCGLELEKGIRRTFYSLVRYLIRYVQKLLSKNERKSGYEIILFLFTRLMLIQWKMEDFKFLQEISAAETLFRITIDTAFVPALVGTRENPNELDTYRQHRSYAKEAVKDFDNWFSEFSELSDANKEVHMFIAQNSDVMDVKISCDGCERIVSGRRFRSLTCRDLDLCTDCYISGVRPEEHMGEYEVVEFCTICHSCRSFIIGTKVMCSSCNVIWCYGCFNAGIYNTEHAGCSSDSVTKLTTKIAKFQKKRTLEPLRTYLHNYSWNLFTGLAIYAANSKLKISEVTAYREASDQIANRCLELIIGGLENSSSTFDTLAHPKSDKESLSITVPLDISDSTTESVAFKQYPSNSAENNEKGLEAKNYVENSSAHEHGNTHHKGQFTFAQKVKYFSSCCQDRVLGLISTMLITERRDDDDLIKEASQISEFLLPALLAMIGDNLFSKEVSSLCYGVLMHYMKWTNPQVADKAVSTVLMKSSKPKTEQRHILQQTVTADATLDFLFSMIKKSLNRCDFTSIYGVASVLLSLKNSSLWSSVLFNYIIRCLTEISDSQSTIAALISLAGFPKIPFPGSICTQSDTLVGSKPVVILYKYFERSECLTCDLRSHIRRIVPASSLKIKGDLNNCHATQMMYNSVLRSIVTCYKNKCQDSERSFESELILLYILKNVYQCLNVPDSETFDLIIDNVIGCIFQLSCEAVSIDKNWIVEDLELLAIYARKTSMTATAGTDSKEVNEEEVFSGDDSASVSSSSSHSDDSSFDDAKPDQDPKDSKVIDPLEGLPPEARDGIQTIHEALNAPVAFLRAMFESLGSNLTQFIDEVQRRYTNDGMEFTDEIKQLAKQWMPNETSNSKALLSDDGATNWITIRTSSILEPDDGITFTPERSDLSPNLIAEYTDKEMKRMILDHNCAESSELLSKELKRLASYNDSRAIEIAHAASVLYARKIVSFVFANWPRNRSISENLLGPSFGVDLTQFFCLLFQADDSQTFEMIVKNIVKWAEPHVVLSLYLSASASMSNAKLSFKTRESSHDYDNDDETNDSFKIENSNWLMVFFDSQCITERDCDILTLATSSSFQENRHDFSGAGPWDKIILPGDTVHFKFTCQCSGGDWGWKFTVVGGELDKFDVGYKLLCILLSQTTSKLKQLPLNGLWMNLIKAAAIHTSYWRLMAVKLLLKLLELVSSIKESEEDSISVTEIKKQIDLTQLKRLWFLYCHTLDDRSDCSFCPLARALTDLFLLTEDLAAKWRVTDDIMATFIIQPRIGKLLLQGASRVVGLSKMIDEECSKGITNVVRKIIKEHGQTILDN